MSTVNNIGTATDSRVFFYRPDGSCYAILSSKRFKELRRYKRLESFLDKERDSGVILDAKREGYCDAA